MFLAVYENPLLFIYVMAILITPRCSPLRIADSITRYIDKAEPLLALSWPAI
jgi:hypothetical protein